MIPRRIVTTWICDPARDGYNERHREMLAQCLTSWLRLMPDYELEFVTMGNIRRFGTSEWLEARLAEGNFIAASQYARIVWLKWLGGVFVDADVEAAQRFDSLLADEDVLTLGHLGNGQGFANNAVMAAAAGHPALLEMERLLYRVPPTHADYGNATGPVMVTHMLREQCWDGADREMRIGDVQVRRSAVFYPYNWNQGFTPECVQADTIALHHWASSWKPREQQPHHVWRERR